MDILPSNLVSLDGRYYDKGKQGALYSRLTEVRVVLWKTKGGKKPRKKKKNRLGNEKEPSVCWGSLGNSIHLCLIFTFKLCAVTCWALELFNYA